MGVRNKLFSSIFTVVALFTILAIFLAYELKDSADNIERLYLDDFVPVNTVNQIDGALTRVDINILRMIAIGDQESIAGWKKENEVAYQHLDEYLLALSTQFKTAQERATVSELKLTYERLRDGMRQQVSVIEQGNSAGAAEINRELVKPNAERIFRSLQELRVATSNRADLRLEKQLTDTQERLYIAAGSIFLIVLLSVFLVWLVVRHIMAQIGGEPIAVAEATRAIAEGDLTKNIAVIDGQDQSVVASIGYMQRQLRDTLRKIATFADELSNSAIAMKSATSVNVAELARQNGEVDQAVTAVTEMSSAVEEVARNAEYTSRSSQQAARSVAEGEAHVSSTSEALSGMTDEVRHSASLIERLAQQAHGIGRVLDVIRGLADQTNLLALNAAIEAARAGEAGRGFAVVADEVRALAHRTQSSTQEIEQMVSGIQSGSAEAESAMKTTVKLADTTMTIAEKASTALGVINRSVAEINEQNLVIASAAQEQAQVSREVDRNLVNIRDLSIHSAESAQQVALRSESLSRLADELKRVVAGFRFNS